MDRTETPESRRPSRRTRVGGQTVRNQIQTRVTNWPCNRIIVRPRRRSDSYARCLGVARARSKRLHNGANSARWRGSLGHGDSFSFQTTRYRDEQKSVCDYEKTLRVRAMRVFSRLRRHESDYRGTFHGRRSTDLEHDEKLVSDGLKPTFVHPVHTHTHVYLIRLIYKTTRGIYIRVCTVIIIIIIYRYRTTTTTRRAWSSSSWACARAPARSHCPLSGRDARGAERQGRADTRA